ncbi:MAG TPA: ferritin-like domain-containing protein [Pyrinomonadaceae bacterium]|nr:ferritin-like domain-containing protein [Pyrinomonadaceae bacterium]
MGFDDKRTRRDVLKLGVAFGAAGIGASLLDFPGVGVFAASAGRERVIGNSRANRENDVKLFNDAAQLEQKAVNTYTAARDAKLIKTPAFLEVALQFASDHAQHRDADLKVVRSLGGMPAPMKGLGTAPIPDAVLKGTEEDVIRYALGIEVYAAKAYQEYVAALTQTQEGIEQAASNMGVEAQHAATYRAVLIAILNKMGLPGEPNRIVPFGLLELQPKPELPAGQTLPTDASAGFDR